VQERDAVEGAIFRDEQKQQPVNDSQQLFMQFR
jgi:hypothetical protein